jgi:hypothetical protein
MQADWAVESGFCLRDYRHVARCLAEIPEWYVALRVELGSKRQQADDRVSGSRTPPVPLRLDFDATIRDMLLILCSWEERVRDAARLTPLETEASRRRRDEVALPAAVKVLTDHFDTLLGLPPAPMARVWSLRAAEEAPDGAIVNWHRDAGYAEMCIDVDGTGAGLELVSLQYRARSALRATNPPPERLLGVPCKRCDHLSLERAAPSRSPEGPDYWSECSLCGNLLTRIEYLAWVRLYARWAEDQQVVPMLEVS